MQPQLQKKMVPVPIFRVKLPAITSNHKTFDIDTNSVVQFSFFLALFSYMMPLNGNRTPYTLKAKILTNL